MNTQLKQEIMEVEKLIDKKIEDFDGFDWDYISKNQKISEFFIEKYEDNINWFYISIYQKLSESFIEKYEDKFDWDYILENQNLSEKFIEKNKNNFLKKSVDF